MANRKRGLERRTERVVFYMEKSKYKALERHGEKHGLTVGVGRICEGFINLAMKDLGIMPEGGNGSNAKTKKLKRP